jgi:transposase InsO family protein
MACKKLRALIDSHPIVLETDHRNLLNTQEHHSPLTRRWMAFLQANFNIAAFLHRPGVLNELADMLSRLYHITSMDAVSVIQQYDSVETAVTRIMEYATPVRDSEDADLAHIAMLIEAAESARADFWPTLGTRINHPVPGGEAAALCALTPEQAFADVHNARQGHSGWRRTLARLRKLHPGTQISQKQVRSLVEDCATCQKYRTTLREENAEVLHSLPAPTLSGLVTADTFKLPKDSAANTHVLLIINHATKMVDLIPMTSKAGEEVAKALFLYCCNEGTPGIFLTDPGSELTNEHTDALLSWLGITHHLTLAKRPQGHGTERSIGKAKQNLAILVGTENAIHKWSDRTILPAIKLMLNRDVNDEVGASPLTLRYGTVAMARFARLANPEALPSPNDAPRLIDELDANLKELQARADDTQNRTHR